MAKVAGVSPDTPSALITARSARASAPTTLAVAVLPSLKVTVIEPPLAALATTWLLVTIVPSAE